MLDELLGFWNDSVERCGIVLSGGAVVEIPNQASMLEMSSRSEFAMLRKDVSDAILPGNSICGVFHTHPSNVNRPSTMDIAGWPVGVDYYIVTEGLVTEWKLVGSRAILISRQGAGSALADPLHSAPAAS